MNGPVHSQFRLVVALLCGVSCFVVATFRMQTPLAQAATVAFGCLWIVQAYVIGNQLRTDRG